MKNLKNVERFLSERERRDRLVHTCLPPGHPAHCKAYLFKHFHARLYDKRWHQVVEFIESIRPLLEVLRQCWDAG
eukprot:8628075-Alexandrium_andersonii.AAC.1